METESEELKKNLTMCQVMHMGKSAMHVSSLGAVPAPGGDSKMLAESLASACRLSQRRVQWFGKGEETAETLLLLCGSSLILLSDTFLLPPQS